MIIVSLAATYSLALATFASSFSRPIWLAHLGGPRHARRILVIRLIAKQKKEQQHNLNFGLRKQQLSSWEGGGLGL
jgi:hypothetical protein